MASKIVDKIKDIVGEDVFTNCTGTNDFINGAVMEVANIVPVDLLMKYYSGAVTVLNTSSSTTTVTNKVVLSVIRQDGTSGPWRDCMQVNEVDFKTKYQDDNSTYKATKLTPVWAVVRDSLTIEPEPTDTSPGNVYIFSYPTTDWASSNDEYFTGMPTELEQAILFRAAMNIVQSYISNAVQDDEDSEMQTMLASQAQALSTGYQQEIARFTKGSIK